MEKESKKAAQRIVFVLEGKRYKKEVTKLEMETANANDKPLDPIGILSKFKFIAYSLYGGDVFFSDLFTYFPNVHVYGTS